MPKTKAQLTTERAQQLDRLCAQLTILEREDYARKWPTNHELAGTWCWKRRHSFVAVDHHMGSCQSGAFLCDLETGELYNIKAYGVPDYNKKVKADIGNIATVDPKELHQRRWNYLR